MDFNYVTQGKAIPLGVILITLFYLLGGSSSGMGPYFIITCILVAFIKNNTLGDSVVAATLTSIFGIIIVSVISLGSIYLMYGETYLIYILSSYYIYIVFYLIGGIIGGIIGHYLDREIKKSNTNPYL
ncbi:MAG: DUF5518 domain-containing protein [Methanosphaera sp.]|nr:DUF5518 domain-containing protein [Methanosphaera sp.]